jgi:hypothetical protein
LAAGAALAFLAGALALAAGALAIGAAPACEAAAALKETAAKADRIRAEASLFKVNLSEGGEPKTQPTGGRLTGGVRIFTARPAPG